LNDYRRQRKIILQRQQTIQKKQMKLLYFSHRTSATTASQPSYSYYTVTSLLIKTFCYDKMYFECNSFGVVHSRSLYLKLNLQV
jgi:hypothetical protein